ncbi:fumarylacetoacetate hydrolase family protein [Paralcaligenes sp. KSB-10]|jgi:2-keto-4-pentenoate hydratase/2-oxohepta-3-ene-1,7-dioic acid hydratase in catechol pathway|uniref:fumarylacetoacetate hydrolase family protein n=1 Tax=Paralcaligenes sp. KSB-10 TaxID=2901142 RepID=UPI001E53BF4A|nr:fumarylacetoacetate hydrolase family protein [Paralcaligenes sp. KSB-10]UHL65022.1 fumarylacetoacetate hydrolase family protein [Paralcaligenes sp. KSB-10]
MRLATFEYQGRRGVGLVSDDLKRIRTLKLDAEIAAQGIASLIEQENLKAFVQAHLADEVSVADVTLQAPIPRPRRNIFCVGRNYHAHAKELSSSVFKENDKNVASWPIVFTKVPECVVGPFDNVVLPVGISSQIDYEAELAVVIGVKGKNISREDAMSHVFGYTIVNDVTARDVQIRHQQWDMGKSFDTFCPMGPWLLTADEIDSSNVQVSCTVNGELRQNASTQDFIFDIPTLIETCSRGITLYPGDIIATGTPAGVGMGMKPPVYLKAGDCVRVEIAGIGAIENKFV